MPVRRRARRGGRAPGGLERPEVELDAVPLLPLLLLRRLRGGVEVVERRGGLSGVGGAGAGAGVGVAIGWVGWAGRAVCVPSGLGGADNFHLVLPVKVVAHARRRAARRLQREARGEGGGGAGYRVS